MDSLQKVRRRFNSLLKKGAKAFLVVERVDGSEAKRRRDICQNRCTANQYDNENDKCNYCGCFMEIKSQTLIHHNPKKLRKELTHCPFGLWNDKDIANHYRKIDKLTLLQ